MVFPHIHCDTCFEFCTIYFVFVIKLCTSKVSDFLEVHIRLPLALILIRNYQMSRNSINVFPFLILIKRNNRFQSEYTCIHIFCTFQGGEYYLSKEFLFVHHESSLRFSITLANFFISLK